jgi:hypothetical protein
VYYADWAFNTGAEVGAGDHHSDFKEALFFWIKACHFTVNPN